MAEPRVSVIVVSYNRAADLELCLQAIFGSRFDGYEVIVVDNASSDEAPAVARSFERVQLIESAENLGFAAGNNLGLERARGEYVALVNNDAVIDEAWLGELVAFLDAHPLAAAVGGRLYHWNEDNPLGDTNNGFYGYSRLAPDASTPAVADPPDAEREVAFVSGAAVLVRRRAIDAVGAPFLDPTYFMYYEETDFFARAIRKGWRVHFLSRARCWHRIRGGARVAPYRYHYYMHRNRLLFAQRHFDDAALASVMRTARRRAASARLRIALGIGGQKTEALRARRDAWSWAEENRGLLEAERARFAGFGAPLSAALRAIEQRRLATARSR